MVFKISFSFHWTVRDDAGNDISLQGYALSAPISFDIPFFPRRYDELTCSEITGEVTHAYWDCDKSTGELCLCRHLRDELTCRQWARRLEKRGWNLDDELPDGDEPVLVVPQMKEQLTTPSLDWSRIAAIKRETDRASKIIQAAMGE